MRLQGPEVQRKLPCIYHSGVIKRFKEKDPLTNHADGSQSQKLRNILRWSCCNSLYGWNEGCKISIHVAATKDATSMKNKEKFQEALKQEMKQLVRQHKVQSAETRKTIAHRQK